MPRQRNEEKPENLLYKHLRNIAGSRELNVNGDGAAVVFGYTAPGNTHVAVERLLLKMTDAAMTMAKFGGLAALSTGLAVCVTDPAGTVVLDFTDGHNVRLNDDWHSLGGTDVVTIDKPGSGDDFLAVRWTLAKCGTPLWLPPGYTFQLVVNDDLTEISSFHAFIQGNIYND